MGPSRILRLDWVENVERLPSWNHVLGWLAAATIVLSVVVGFVEFRRLTLEREISELREELEARQRQATRDSRRHRVDPSFEKSVRDHNEVVSLLAVIEKVPMEGVRVDEILLQPEVRVFRIEARAANAAAAQRYVTALSDADVEGGWTIVQMKPLTNEPGFGLSAVSLKREPRRP